ncbi:hypothetical protein [Streptomyces sp. NPDC050759]|uniref:hypothetical protein n=1 Tax=Streptomyces sp. NPDC050759 TaxID=3365635 RepID=UPI0037B6B710
MAEPHPRQTRARVRRCLAPDPAIGARFVEAHHAAREVLRDHTGAKVGWMVAGRAFVARPGGEEKTRELEYIWEDLYLAGARGDDFVGVQSYSSQWVGLQPVRRPGGCRALPSAPGQHARGDEYPEGMTSPVV